MIKLKIVKKNKQKYILSDIFNNEFIVYLDFIGIDVIPKEGNYICMHEELLNSGYEGYSNNYTFGDINSKYGKSDIKENDIDSMLLICDDKQIKLKRLYG